VLAAALQGPILFFGAGVGATFGGNHRGRQQISAVVGGLPAGQLCAIASQTCERLCVHSVFAFQAPAARNVDGCAKRLCNEMTGLAMLRSLPMLGLMLKFQHGRPPANTCIRSESTATRGPGIAVRMLVHTSIVKAQAPGVMNSEGTRAPIRDSGGVKLGEQRPVAA
jgi:hypothetical protein